jgi:hypothetical protein
LGERPASRFEQLLAYQQARSWIWTLRDHLSVLEPAERWKTYLAENDQVVHFCVECAESEFDDDSSDYGAS